MSVYLYLTVELVAICPDVCLSVSPPVHVSSSHASFHLEISNLATRMGGENCRGHLPPHPLGVSQGVASAELWFPAVKCGFLLVSDITRAMCLDGVLRSVCLVGG